MFNKFVGSDSCLAIQISGGPLGQLEPGKKRHQKGVHIWCEGSRELEKKKVCLSHTRTVLFVGIQEVLGLYLASISPPHASVDLGNHGRDPSLPVYPQKVLS